MNEEENESLILSVIYIYKVVVKLAQLIMFKTLDCVFQLSLHKIWIVINFFTYIDILCNLGIIFMFKIHEDQ